MPTYLGNAENVIWVPELVVDLLRRHDQVGHGAHQGPAGDRNNGALDPALAALLRGPQRVDDVGMFLLVVGLDGLSLVAGVAVGLEQRVRQGERDEAAEGEDEEGEEFGLEK